MKKNGLVAFLIFICLTMFAGVTLAERSGGTIVVPVPYGGTITTLDAHQAVAPIEYVVTFNINRSLYRWDAEAGQPVIDLAFKVEISPDGLNYTYYLRKNVQFHNGRIMTADDILWSYHRIINKKTASTGAKNVRLIKGAAEYENGTAESISGLKKINDFILQMTLTGPMDPAYPLYQANTAILPKEEVARDNFGTSPVGCGPFVFSEWVKGSHVVLNKNQNYFVKGRPLLDKIVWKVAVESSARDMAFRAKELDLNVVNPTQYPVYKKDPTLSKNMIEVAEAWTRVLMFNLEVKPFNIKEVRQAINWAIPSDLLTKKIARGKAYPASGYLPISSPAFDPNAKSYGYDLAKAKALMKKAGYENGFTFTAMGTQYEGWGVDILTALIPFLKKINIEMKIEQVEIGAAIPRLNKGEYEAWMVSYFAGPDPLTQALSFFHSDNDRTAGNTMAYNNPAFDTLLDKARQEVNINPAI